MSQGGKRSGAGRKPLFEGDKTIAMRVPERLKPVIDQWLDEYRQLAGLNASALENPRMLGAQLNQLSLPLFASRVPAGTPVPADDLRERDIDLNQHLVRHPESTFLVTVKGDSMIDAGINDGDLLVVDHAVEPRPGKVVVAVLNGELTVKRLFKSAQQVLLVPENPAYQPIEIHEGASFFIWGVVTNVIHPVV